jgi:hypothetical protein
MCIVLFLFWTDWLCGLSCICRTWLSSSSTSLSSSSKGGGGSCPACWVFCGFKTKIALSPMYWWCAVCTSRRILSEHTPKFATKSRIMRRCINQVEIWGEMWHNRAGSSVPDLQQSSDHAGEELGQPRREAYGLEGNMKQHPDTTWLGIVWTYSLHIVISFSCDQYR